MILLRHCAKLDQANAAFVVAMGTSAPWKPGIRTVRLPLSSFNPSTGRDQIQPPMKTNTILFQLPLELLYKIFGCLPLIDIKQCRLVCKVWGYHAAKSFNLDTVYLSPRKHDMEVFNNITQHPIFSTQVKHLVYDSAQFVDFSGNLWDYARILSQQIDSEDFKPISSEDPSILHLDKLMNGRRRKWDFRRIEREDITEEIRNDSVLLKSFRYYCHLARQRQLFLSDRWFSSASRGLRRLQRLETVAIHETWKLVLTRWDDDGNYDSPSDWDYVVVEQGNGANAGLSPVARRTPPWVLLPTPRRKPFVESSAAELKNKSKSDGALEFVRVVELLHSTGHRPLKIDIPGDWRRRSGVSCLLLSPMGSTWKDFLIVCSKLESLDLHLADLNGTTLGQMPGFKALLRNLPSLRRLSLKLPYYPEESQDAESMFHISHIIPAQPWYHLTLNCLELSGLSTTYRDLAALLFVGLPALMSLTLSYINLHSAGDWEDFIEGLHRSPNIHQCYIKDPLTYENDRWYCSTDEDRGWGTQLSPLWESEGHIQFLTALSNYINEGGRHPSLRDDEDTKDSDRFMDKLDTTINQIKSGYAFRG